MCAELCKSKRFVAALYRNEKKGVEKKVTAKKSRREFDSAIDGGDIQNVRGTHTRTEGKRKCYTKKKKKQERLKNAGKITRKQQES